MKTILSAVLALLLGVVAPSFGGDHKCNCDKACAEKCEQGKGKEACKCSEKCGCAEHGKCGGADGKSCKGHHHEHGKSGEKSSEVKPEEKK